MTIYRRARANGFTIEACWVPKAPVNIFAMRLEKTSLGMQGMPVPTRSCACSGSDMKATTMPNEIANRRPGVACSDDRRKCCLYLSKPRECACSAIHNCIHLVRR